MFKTEVFWIVSYVVWSFSFLTHAQDAMLSTEHDGKWLVALVCDDVKDKGGFVRGYAFTFPVDVKAGRLFGEHQERGSTATVRFEGTVAVGGALEIRATGTTGSPEYSVGYVPRGRPYGYTMTGQMSAKSGTATRRELRPCNAAFTRQSV